MCVKCVCCVYLSFMNNTVFLNFRSVRVLVCVCLCVRACVSVCVMSSFEFCDNSAMYVLHNINHVSHVRRFGR